MEKNNKPRWVVLISVGCIIFGSVVILGAWWVGSIKAQANVENTLDQINDSVVENDFLTNENTKDIIILDKRIVVEEEKSSSQKDQLNRMEGKIDRLIERLIE